MQIVAQIGLVFGVCLAGEVASQLLPIPLPGSVLAMLLLLLLLATKLVRPQSIAPLATFLQNNMVFLFVPAGVAVLPQLPLLAQNVLSFLVVCLLATVATFLATAATVCLVSRLINRGP